MSNTLERIMRELYEGVMGEEEPEAPQKPPTRTHWPKNNDGVYAIDAQVRRALENNDGVFFGEFHYEDFSPTYITSRLDMLQELGVTTIYLELTQDMIENLRAAAASASDGSITLTSGAELLRQAEARGIRVLAHDNARLDLYGVTSENQDELFEYLGARDQASAEYIQATRDGGKYVVWGGALHSRAENSIEQAPSPGLAERLGIPSFDFTPYTNAETQRGLVTESGLRDYRATLEITYPYTNIDQIGQPQNTEAEIFTAPGDKDANYIVMHASGINIDDALPDPDLPRGTGGKNSQNQR